ncbi:TlpA family protein disulfide reductase [Chitinophaga rhizophila]|uniref:TlpA family protein disulfide reductase n=1 Tax=Chitinophaga rhizophila TaxID=2866212 RepID=A0ABS7G7W8_9BACT|nr:TlpA disulfide reductase family protein [Chitinophaga rhizophila]MBW8683739.1 TlpA family protein disulfide reductase [Chitinophaga rhizophila]
MKIAVLYLFVMSMILMVLVAVGQDRELMKRQPLPLKPVAIGTTVPNIVFRNVVNYYSEEVSISQFKGKAILIDFWAAFCQPCLAQFPKLMQFQEEFKSELQIITVTGDDIQKVKALFAEMSYENIRLITATNDGPEVNDSLFFYFPHRYVPHYIWIAPNGVVNAITGYEAVTRENIRSLVQGNPINAANISIAEQPQNFHPALYTYQEADIADQIMLNDSINGLLAYSILTGYKKQYPPSSAIDNSGIYNQRRIRVWNLPLSTMFRLAFGILSPDPSQQRLIPVPKLFFDIRNKETLEKLTKNYEHPPDTASDLYCYDLIIPGKGMRLLQERMKEDLTRYFGVYGAVERKNLVCYTLNMRDSCLIKTVGGAMLQEGNMYYLKLRNSPLSRLVEHIRAYNEDSKTVFYRGIESAILIDETGFQGCIDIDLSVRMNDLQSLKKAIHSYGLELCEEQRWVDVLIIRD